MAVIGIPDKTIGQVCLAVRDADRLSKNYKDILGWDMSRNFQTTLLHDHTHATYYGVPTDSRAYLTSIVAAQLQYELLQPLERPSAWLDGMEQHGEGVHHIAFFVPSTITTAVSLVEHGYKVTQHGLFTGQHGQYTYFDTDKDLGVIIELLEHFQGQARFDEPPIPNGIGSDVICQVGIIVHDLTKTAQRWTEVLGVPVAFALETPGFVQSKTYYKGEPSEATAKLAFFNFGQVQIELIQPDEKPSVWRDYLDQHGEGAQHIAFRVPNTQAAVDFLARHDIPVIQQGLYADGSGMYTYVGSEEKLGVMVELLEDYSR